MHMMINGHTKIGPYYACRYIGVDPAVEVVSWLLFTDVPHGAGGELVGMVYNRRNSGSDGGNQWVARVYGVDHKTNFESENSIEAVAELWYHLNPGATEADYEAAVQAVKQGPSADAGGSATVRRAA